MQKTRPSRLLAAALLLVAATVLSLFPVKPAGAEEAPSTSTGRELFEIMSSQDGILLQRLLSTAYLDEEFLRFATSAQAAAAPVDGAELAPLLDSTPTRSLIQLLEQSKLELTENTLPDYSGALATKVNRLTQDPSYATVISDIQELLRRGDVASAIDANEAIRNSPLLRPGTRGISNFTAAVITAVGAAVVFVGAVLACVPLAVGCATVAVGSAIVFAGALIYAVNEANKSAGYEFQIDNISCVGNNCSAGGLATGPGRISSVSGFCEFKITDGSIYSSSSGACDSLQFFYTTQGPVWNARVGVNDRDTLGCYKTFTATMFVYWANNTYSKDAKTVAKTTTASCL